MTLVEVEPIVETTIITANVNVVHVNVTTRSKTIEELCSRIENKGNKECFWLGERRMGQWWR
jgi:hypothetical protein